MLFYKAWLESRSRFFTGSIAAAGICFFYVYIHPILIPQWMGAMRAADSQRPAWLYLGIHDYRFYTWHFLYDYQFQEAWVFVALLLSLGGLSREYRSGASLFSLGLPVSRKRWILSQVFVASLEALGIALLPAFVVPLGSLFFDERYSFSQGFGHGLLLGLTGLVFISLGNLISIVVRTSYYISMVILLIGLLVPYLFLQEFVRQLPHQSWLYRLDISHRMAGPWLLTGSNFPWMGMLISLLLATALVLVSIRYSRQQDY